MTKNPPKFDVTQYKMSTRKQWDTAAEAWHRWSPLLSKWLGPATETMLDMCDIKEGSRVLDVAAGAGEQTLAVARRIGEKGHVLATDFSPNILKFAAHEAELAGLNNIATQIQDGEKLADLVVDPFDAVISRVGLIYFPDQQKALAGMKHQLRDEGKMGAMVYSTADRNPFFSIPISIIRLYVDELIYPHHYRVSQVRSASVIQKLWNPLFYRLASKISILKPSMHLCVFHRQQNVYSLNRNLSVHYIK